MHPFSIRRATSDDVNDVLALWKAADATPSLTDTAEELARATKLDRVAVLLAEYNGAAIGSVIATFDGWRGNIYRLAVHPDHRRRGVARALLAEADARLHAWGAKRVTALVEKAHADAVAFWEASTYAFDERIVRFVGTMS
jgi:ribosomal protein S18 acetylase RimI-like enzyme